MLIDQATIAASVAAVASLDLSAENARIAHLEAEIERLETAAETGLARVAEVGAIIVERNHPVTGAGRFDHGAVADALFASLDPAEAATASPSIQDLEAERDQLRGGIAELRSRARAATEEIAQVRREANARAMAAVAPLVEELGKEARLAASRIVGAYAAVEAIGTATKSMATEARALRAAMDGLSADYGLRSRADAIEVPPEIVALLAPLAGKGAALRPALIRSIAR